MKFISFTNINLVRKTKLILKIILNLAVFDLFPIF
jgi:hypothetical protein